MIVDKRLTTFINSMNWQLPNELKELEKKALADEVPIIRKSMQSLLIFLMRMKQPERILEIGTAVGFSGLLMLMNTVEGARLDTIEKVPVRWKEAEKNFRQFGREGQIHLYKEDATDVLQRFSQEKNKYDFIFMDAAKGQYPGFLPPILAMLSENGMLVTDNVLQDGDILESRFAITKRDRTIHKRMREFLYTLTHTEGLNTVILPVGDGVSLTTLYEGSVMGELRENEGGEVTC